MKIIPKSRKNVFEEIKEKLTRRGYYISDNYGLILKNKDDESAIADIRYFEKKVVLPYWNDIETVEVKNLRTILREEGITLRDKQANS